MNWDMEQLLDKRAQVIGEMMDGLDAAQRIVELETQLAELRAENARLKGLYEQAKESNGEWRDMFEAAEAKVARVSIVRDECRTAERELIHAADPRGDARIAYGVIADRLDKELQAALSDKGDKEPEHG